MTAGQVELKLAHALVDGDVVAEGVVRGTIEVRPDGRVAVPVLDDTPGGLGDLRWFVWPADRLVATVSYQVA